MEKQKKQEDFIELEKIIKSKYSLLTKIIFLVGIIIVSVLIIVFLGVLIWSYDYDWALINIDNWLLIAIITISILIVIELVLYFKYTTIGEKKIKSQKPKPEFIDNKKVNIFTYPHGMEGGIFSKTYLDLDDHNILCIRALIIHPAELWTNKE
jgi:hypothetical protein